MTPIRSRFHRTRRPIPLLAAVVLAAICSVGAPAQPAGWLGLVLQDVSPELREALELAAEAGALVSEVEPGSPAERAGLRPRDLLVRADDRVIETAGDLVAHTRSRAPGDTIVLVLLRDREEVRIEAILGARPEGEDHARRPQPRADRRTEREVERFGPRPSPTLGIQVRGLAPERALALGLRRGLGLFVVRVAPESPADEAGIRADDILTHCNDLPLARVDDLRRALRAIGPDVSWGIRGFRGGDPIVFRGKAIEPRDRGRSHGPSMERYLRGRPFEGSVWMERQIRRLEREIRDLRSRIRELERQIEREGSRR